MPEPTPRPARPAGILAVVGDIVEDVVVWLDEPIRPATDTASRVFRTRGGSGANVAALAAPLTPTRFIGCVGADAAGDALDGALRASGVDVRLQRRGTTGTVVLLVDLEGERTMFPDRGASAMLQDVDPAWLDGVGHVHAPAYGLEREPMRSELVRVLAAARAAGATISLDASSTGLIAKLGVGRFVELLLEICPDILLANAAEWAMLGRGAHALPETVVVKDGPRPTTVHRDGAVVAHVPVDPVADIRDLTGAGDAFAAGFLAAHLGGAPVEVACLAGHRSAASVLTSPGAQGS